MELYGDLRAEVNRLQNIIETREGREQFWRREQRRQQSGIPGILSWYDFGVRSITSERFFDYLIKQNRTGDLDVGVVGEWNSWVDTNIATVISEARFDYADRYWNSHIFADVAGTLPGPFAEVYKLYGNEDPYGPIASNRSFDCSIVYLTSEPQTNQSSRFLKAAHGKNVRSGRKILITEFTRAESDFTQIEDALEAYKESEEMYHTQVPHPSLIVRLENEVAHFIRKIG